MTPERERLLDEVVTAYLKDAEAGRAPSRDDLIARHPDLADDLAAFFVAESQVRRVAAPLRAPAADDATTGLGEPATGPGTRVEYFGEYHLLDEIGRGGMGVVYKARQETLNRTVALKMILSGQLATDADVKRFRAEAEAAARLDHPGIVTVFEVGQHEGQHYFTMAFVEGESLAHRLAQKLPAPREAADLTRKVAEAVAYAHVEGVVHRDLKPANVLMDRTGQPRLTDFGLAKRVEGDRNLTVTGQIVGTPSYMPPEQASGTGEAVGPHSDVYSLGAILYCLLTGRPPFQADNPLDTLMQVLQRDPVPPRQLNAAVPADLETVALKCLEKDPRKRYASAQDLAADLGRFARGEPIHARPVGTAERAWRWCRRNPTVAAMAAALVVVLVGGAVTSAVFAGQARREARQSADLAVQARHHEDQAVALAAQAKADKDRAEASQQMTRRYLYSAHMNLAHDAWKAGNVIRLEQLLDQHRPAAGDDDLRSFDWGYLRREANRQQRTVALASPDEQAVMFVPSPDGRWIAIGHAGGWLRSTGDDCTLGEVRVWDVAAGKLKHTDRGKMRPADNNPDTQFQAPTFSPDGKLFALVVFDFIEFRHGPENSFIERKQSAPRIVVRDAETMAVRVTIPVPHFALTDRIALSPDGTKLAAGLSEKPASDENPRYRIKTIKVWDLPAAGQPVGEGRVLWHGDLIPEIESPYTDPALARMSFSSDSKAVLWGRWNVETLTVTPVHGEGKSGTLPIIGRYHKVSPDGKYVSGVGGNSAELQLHDAATGKVVHRFPAGVIYDHALPHAFSRDGKRLAIMRGTTVDVWDVESKKQIGEIRGHDDAVRAVGFTPDGAGVFTVSRSKHTGVLEMRVWDATQRPGPDAFDLAADPPKRPHPAYRDPHPHTFYVADLSPDGKTLAANWGWSPTQPLESHAVFLHDVSTGAPGKPLLHLTFDRNDPAGKPPHFQPKRVVVSPGRTHLALCGESHVQLWRLDPADGGVKGVHVRTLDAPIRATNSFPRAEFSPDGTKLVYARRRSGSDNDRPDYLHLHDLATGKDVVFPADPEAWFAHAAGLQHVYGKDVWQGSCQGAAFTADGKRLVSLHAGGRNRIVVWDAATGEALVAFQPAVDLGHGWKPLALSADGRTLATSHTDHSICLWDVSEANVLAVAEELNRCAALPQTERDAAPAVKPRVVLRGHGGNVTALAFHPDGKTLATAGADGTVRVWDAATGELRLTLDGHASAALVFTPDGAALVSADIRGEVKVWRAATIEYSVAK